MKNLSTSKAILAQSQKWEIDLNLIPVEFITYINKLCQPCYRCTEHVASANHLTIDHGIITYDPEAMHKRIILKRNRLAKQGLTKAEIKDKIQKEKKSKEEIRNEKKNPKILLELES